MENNSVARKPELVIRHVAHLPDVTAMTARAGQVLVYPGHYPNGLWIVTTGAVELDGDGPVADAVVLGTADGPFVIPPPGEVEMPSRVRARVAADARILFVPKRLAGIEPVSELAAHSLQLPRRERAGSTRTT